MSSPSSSSTTHILTSLVDFLQSQKQQTKISNIVIGNPAGDADSIVTALCWAYVASWAQEPANGNILTPVMSIPRHDLQTQRPETMLLLQWASVSIDSLLDVTDVRNDPDRFCGAQVTLVDHNRLDTSAFDAGTVLDWTVTGILDHHYDEGLYKDTCDMREIAFENNRATVASTTTLVAERATNNDERLPSDVALLLLGTILLDSVNMNPAAGKGTPRDQAAIDALLANTDWRDGRLTVSADPKLWDSETGRPDPSVFFERLQQAKFDVDFWKTLSVRDALRLDYKQFNPNGSGDSGSPFGASTVLVDWNTFLEKENVPASIAAYMQDVNVSFLAIMCAFTLPNSDELHRQMILCAKQPTLLDDLIQHLQELGPEDNLQLVERTESSVSEGNLHVRAFDQNKINASRKQVAPLLIRYFESCSDRGAT